MRRVTRFNLLKRRSSMAVGVLLITTVLGSLTGCSQQLVGSNQSPTNQVAVETTTAQQNTAQNRVTSSSEPAAGTRQASNGSAPGTSKSSNPSSPGTSKSTNRSGPGTSKSSTAALPASKTLSYQTEGETDVAVAHPYVSTNQPFYLYVMTAYTASAEEHGKDIVTFTQNPEAWMRVEVLDSSLTQSEWEKQAKTLLSATNADIQPVATDHLPGGDFFTDCKVFVANGSGSTAMVFLAHVSGRPVQVFLHLPREWESPAQFEAMMSTIGLTNA